MVEDFKKSTAGRNEGSVQERARITMIIPRRSGEIANSEVEFHTRRSVLQSYCKH